MTDITDHLADIRDRVARAARAAGRNADSITIVAVSKQQSAEAVAAVFAAGQRHFGESYVQEAAAKMAALAKLDMVWHYIGRIQGNKTRAIATMFDWVHTLDRESIALRLNEQRPRLAPPLNVLIQVNQGNEPQKGGVGAGDVAALAAAIERLPRLKLRGLMTVPPNDRQEPAIWFRRLAELRTTLAARGLPLELLSMGMSHDFPAAIAAGAHHVRIGTAIFGERGTAR